MTSLATVFGLIPLALGVEVGSEANAPLARAVVGGLLVSTFLTLFVVPALYSLVEERLRRRFSPPPANRTEGVDESIIQKGGAE